MFFDVLRFTSIPWKISRVRIDGQDWRFFGSDWTALRPTAGGTSTIDVEYLAPSQDPQIVDSTSLVHSAGLLDGVLTIELDERFLDTGQCSLFLPRPARIYIDEILSDCGGSRGGSRGGDDNEFSLGHQKLRYAKGAHRITMEIL